MSTETVDFAADWQTWHDAREFRLRDPRGWLAITAIHWLGAEPECFDDVPGEWSAAVDDTATVVLVDGETLDYDGITLGAGVHPIGPVDAAGATVAFTSDGQQAVAQVAQRPGGVIVRPRRPDSATLRTYQGTPSYPADPTWVIEGRFEPAATPEDENVGEVVFTHAGAEHRLRAWDNGEADGSLWILFRDATSGVTTYAANRQLMLEAPDAEGRVEIDFNRAINMPCAYTSFATCPLPPRQNTLPFAVEAGEKVPDFES